VNSHLDRRNLLRLMGLTSLSVAIAACGEPLSQMLEIDDLSSATVTPEGTSEPLPPPPPTPTPEPPFVLPAGEERHSLMASTPYETPLYVFGSGRPGRIALVLGGVHGNEPGGWLAAERVIEQVRPENGALLVVPRANKVAINMLERTTTAMGDLNRSYPGFADGLPMERMAAEIVGVIRDYHVDLVHDMHESWAFYKDRTTNGTAFLGQTVSTNGDEGYALVQTVIEHVNRNILHPREEFFVRDFGGQNSPNQSNPNLPRQADVPPPGRGTSSLGINRTIPGLISILVEMGQQQTLERRIALHVQLFKEVLSETGVIGI
jgi:hypothetical protein